MTEYCLQSGHHTTPNLNERIRGVRLALSADTRAPGPGRWREISRCPLYSNGKRDTAVLQMELMISSYDPPPVMIAVAGFAQFSPDYIPRFKSLAPRIASKEVVIISADTEPLQMQALSQGLSTANIGQKPFEMGRLGAELLYRYIRFGERPAKDAYHLGYHYCTPASKDTCTVE